MRTAICPGSFDPVTLGHVDIIRRASKLFEKVVVCVVYNANKKSSFLTLEERKEHVERVTADLPNVTVDTWSGLLVDYAARYEDPVVVRGLRAVSDYEKECQMALMNKRLYPELETFFLAASEKYMYLSSSAVKELAMFGADLSAFAPREIIGEIEAKYKQERTDPNHGKRDQ